MHCYGKRLAALLCACAVSLTLWGCENGGSPSSQAVSQGESTQEEISSGESSQAESAPEEISSGGSSLAESSSSGETEETETLDFKTGLDENGCFEGIKALDYVTLPDYNAMEVPKEDLEISDEELDQAVQAFFTDWNKDTKQVTDRAVEDGDMVNIDYVGSVDGVEFQGGNTQGQGTTVTIGVTNYIDGFLEKLIGHKPGETFDLNVTFPEDYGQEDLNGKAAVFKTTINYIEEYEYKELTDQFAKEKLKQYYGWDTAEKVRAGIKEKLQREAAWESLWKKILEEGEIKEIPQTVKDFHLRMLKNSYLSMAQRNGMTLEIYLRDTGIGSIEALAEVNKEKLESNQKESLMIQALSEDLGIVPTEEDVRDFFLRDANAVDTAMFESFYGKPYVNFLARESMVKQQLGAKAAGLQ